MFSAASRTIVFETSCFLLIKLQKGKHHYLLILLPPVVQYIKKKKGKENSDMYHQKKDLR